MAANGRYREADRADVPAGSDPRVRAVDRAAAAQTERAGARPPLNFGAGTRRGSPAQITTSNKGVKQRRQAEPDTVPFDAAVRRCCSTPYRCSIVTWSRSG